MCWLCSRLVMQARCWAMPSGGADGSFPSGSRALSPSPSLPGWPQKSLQEQFFSLSALTWKEAWDTIRFPGGPAPLGNGSGDRDTLPPVPSPSPHPGAQISTLEFFTG